MSEENTVYVVTYNVDYEESAVTYRTKAEVLRDVRENFEVEDGIADNSRARDCMEIGKSYMVRKLEVDRFDSRVYLESVPGFFNTVMFENVVETPLPEPYPAPYTEDEARDMFLAQLDNVVGFWSKLPHATTHDRLHGAIFSVLSMTDGVSSLPGMAMTIEPHEDDKAYHIAHGERWFEPGTFVSDGTLHEKWAERRLNVEEKS